MFRKNLIPLLLDHSKSIAQIAREVREAPKDIEDDLEHLLKSLKHTEYEAVVAPAACRKCGFQFGIDKLNKPSKCPKCHGTWVTEPRIELRLRKDTPSA